MKRFGLTSGCLRKAAVEERVELWPSFSQVAVKNNVDVFYFATSIPINLLLTEDGEMEKRVFLATWKDIPSVNESQYHIVNVAIDSGELGEVKEEEEEADVDLTCFLRRQVRQQTEAEQHLHDVETNCGRAGHAVPIDEAHQRNLGARRAKDSTRKHDLCGEACCAL